MATAKQVREYIAGRINEFENIGVVFEKNKLPKSSRDFKDLFVYDERIQAWIITRSALATYDKRANFPKYQETYSIATFLGFSDSLDSETLFEQSIDKVYHMFSRDTTLGGLVANVISVSIGDISLSKVGDILAHYADIVIEVEQYIE